MFDSSFCLLTEKVTNEEAKKERTSKCICFHHCVTKKEKVMDEEEKKEERSKIVQQFFSQNSFVSLIDFQRF